MALFALVFMAVALVLIGVGLAMGLVGCLLAAVLAGFSMVSSSIFLAVRTGRPGVGLRVFFLQCGVLLGAPAGAVCAWLAKSFFAAYGDGAPVLIYGALGGAFAGILVALWIEFIVRRLQGWASARLPGARPRLRG